MFGKANKCWFCGRKVKDEEVYLSKEKIKEIFGTEGIFASMEVREAEKLDWVVCDICTGLMNYLASDSTKIQSRIKDLSKGVTGSVKSFIPGKKEKSK